MVLEGLAERIADEGVLIDAGESPSSFLAISEFGRCALIHDEGACYRVY